MFSGKCGLDDGVYGLCVGSSPEASTALPLLCLSSDVALSALGRESNIHSNNELLPCSIALLCSVHGVNQISCRPHLSAIVFSVPFYSDQGQNTGSADCVSVGGGCSAWISGFSQYI